MIKKIINTVKDKLPNTDKGVEVVRRRLPKKQQGRVRLGTQLKDNERIEVVRARRAERIQDTRRSQRARSLHYKQYATWAIGSMLVLAFVGSRFFITNVAIEGIENSQQSERFKQISNSYFTGVGSRFKPAFDTEAFNQYFAASINDISSVTTEVGSVTTSIYVTPEERTNTVGWIDQRRDSYFLVDTQGVAYEQIGVLPSAIPVVTDVSGIKVLEGDTVVSVDTLSFIRDLYTRSIDGNLAISGFILDDTTRDIEATLEGQSFRVKFSTNRTPVEQMKDLIPVMNLLEGEGRLPSSHIDVRVADKVFYQ